MEIQYYNKKLVDSIKLNFKEAKYNVSVPIEEFLLTEPALFKENKPSIVKVSKYHTCSSTAYEKVIDGLSY